MSLFGVCAKYLPKQVNCLIDEGELTGKGANETISYLHYYFETENAIKCKNVNPHCDNCRGQNKNNAVIQYLCLRTLRGLNSNTELSFMLPYHTRFGPDWCFGLITMKYKHSYVSSISQLAEVVLTPIPKSINIPQLISEPCSDKSLVPFAHGKCSWKPISERYLT